MHCLNHPLTLQFAGTLWGKDSLDSHTVNRVKNLELFNVIKKALSTVLSGGLLDVE